METFVWTGRTRQGVTQRGESLSASREEVISLLRKENIFVTSIEKKKEAFDYKRLFQVQLQIGSGISEKEIVVFTRQFATMIDAGLPLVQCLEILAKQSKNPQFAKVLSQVQTDVEGGTTYTDALRKHVKVFDELYVSMVSAGEVGGILDTILNRLAAYIEKAMKLKKKIKGAMIYPGVTLSVAVIIVIILLVYVIPTFAQMFAGTGHELPAMTRMVLGVSDLVKNNILILIVGVIASALGVNRYYKTDKGHAHIDRLLLHMPIVGELIQKIAVARFTRTLGTLLGSGVPILEGLDIVAKTAGNKVIEQSLNKARNSISEGKPIYEPLEADKVFPLMVVQMIAVGETTGALDTMLAKIADFYDDEVDASVNVLTSLLEPALMIFLGVTIGTVLIAMYLPIFKLASVVG